MNPTILVALFLSVIVTTIYTEKQKKKYENERKEKDKEKEKE